MQNIEILYCGFERSAVWISGFLSEVGCIRNEKIITKFLKIINLILFLKIFFKKHVILGKKNGECKVRIWIYL